MLPKRKPKNGADTDADTDAPHGRGAGALAQTTEEVTRMAQRQLQRIDCHTHYVPSTLADALVQASIQGTEEPSSRMLRSRPAWKDLGLLTAELDRLGVDLAVVVPNARILDGLKRLGGPLHELTAHFNRSLSADLDRAGGRFVATATVDPFGGREELAQLDRALALPHIVGIGLTANYGGISLNDPRFRPIFELARDHDAPITIHPEGPWPGWTDALHLEAGGFLASGLGFLLDNALCLFHMILAGVLDDFPTVRFLFCQLGGVALTCCRRWAHHSNTHRLSHPGQPLPRWAEKTLAEYLAHVWLDTHTQDRYVMRLALEEAGEHTVVLGGDYPFTLPAQGLEFALGELDALELAPAVRTKIERDNALAFLGPRVAG